MKKIKTIVSLLVIAVLLVLMTDVNKLPVSAEEESEPVTYVVKYIESAGGWRYQSGDYYWRDKVSHRELYYMTQSIKDGDILVIDGSEHMLNLTLPVSLGNITFCHAPYAVVTANSVEDVYVLKDSTVAVNGDVVNAYVYDNATVNFNNNVTNLHIRKDSADDQTIAVIGTVDYVESSVEEWVTLRLYSFPENTFRVNEGSLKTEESNFSTVPPVVEDSVVESN
ncbi:MAG: hypothetical protein HDQ96_13405 [Lachnospiraceae bacterium]|nr:hypothetical protein [Lachnospiraceae bacterium]